MDKGKLGIATIAIAALAGADVFDKAMENTKNTTRKLPRKNSSVTTYPLPNYEMFVRVYSEHWGKYTVWMERDYKDHKDNTFLGTVDKHSVGKLEPHSASVIGKTEGRHILGTLLECVNYLARAYRLIEGE